MSTEISAEILKIAGSEEDSAFNHVVEKGTLALTHSVLGWAALDWSWAMTAPLPQKKCCRL